jgi:hypothetical protein
VPRTGKLTAAILLCALASAAAAAAAPLPPRLVPDRVHAGARLRVSGGVGSRCPGARRVTIVSPAFTGATRRLYYGKPAVLARISRRHTYSVEVRLAKRALRASYFVDVRCGLRDVGSATVTIV